MIATILPGSTDFHAVGYNERKVSKGVARLIEMQNFGVLGTFGKPTPDEMVKFLQEYSSRNSRIKKAQFHVAISCKGHEMTESDLLDFAHRYLAEMGYMRPGRLSPSGKNVIVDLLRKVIDGTVRIPTRDEVRSRIKVAYVCNNTSNVEDELYAGLYGVDGNKRDNRTWLKRTGRYLTIPTFATVPEYDGFDIVVTQTEEHSYASRWPSESAKVAELNSLYPEEYTGTMYVGRAGNRLLAYNPYLNEDIDTEADIPLKYNTCESVQLEFTPHIFAVIEEEAEGIEIYLNNYRTDKDELWEQYPSVSEEDGLPSMSYGGPQDYTENVLTDNPTDKELRCSVISVSGCTSRQW